MNNKYKSGPKTSINDYQSFAPKSENDNPVYLESKFRLSKSVGLKFISTLKDNNYIQTLGGLSAGANKVCAVGVLAIIMGFPLDGNCYRKVISIVGQPLVTQLFRLNDADKLSLKQIGVWVEKNVELF